MYRRKQARTSSSEMVTDRLPEASLMLVKRHGMTRVISLQNRCSLPVYALAPCGFAPFAQSRNAPIAADRGNLGIHFPFTGLPSYQPGFSPAAHSLSTASSTSRSHASGG